MSKTSEVTLKIDNAFAEVVKAIARTAKEENLTSAVDIKLEFKQIGISESGFIIFGKKSTQNQLSMTLATRILPEDLESTA